VSIGQHSQFSALFAVLQCNIVALCGLSLFPIRVELRIEATGRNHHKKVSICV